MPLGTPPPPPPPPPPPSLWTIPSRWQWPSATGTLDVTITSFVLPVRGKSANFSCASSGNWSKNFWMVCQSSNAETQLGGASVMSYTGLPLTFCSHNISVFRVGDTLLPEEHRCNFSRTTFSSNSLPPANPNISAKRCNHPQIAAIHNPNQRSLKSPGQVAWLAHSWAPVSWAFHMPNMPTLGQNTRIGASSPCDVSPYSPPSCTVDTLAAWCSDKECPSFVVAADWWLLPPAH